MLKTMCKVMKTQIIYPKKEFSTVKNAQTTHFPAKFLTFSTEFSTMMNCKVKYTFGYIKSLSRKKFYKN